MLCEMTLFVMLCETSVSSYNAVSALALVFEQPVLSSV